MDISLVASGLVAFLAPYFVKGGEAFAENAGKSAWQHVNRLLGKLKMTFASDSEATTTIASFETNSARYKSALEEILVDKLKNDNQLAAELARMLQEAGPYVTLNQKAKNADVQDAGSVDEFGKGRIDVSQEADTVTYQKGLNIKKMGT